MKRALFALILAAAGCGAHAAAPVSRVRFANADPVTAVDDRRDVPVAPKKRPKVDRLGHFDELVARRVDRALAGEPSRRALGVNSLGEVPDSTWFENRLGVRDFTAEEIARGPGDGRGPDLSRPLAVFKAKTTGAAPGFMAEDAAGVRWMIKPEPMGYAAESATDVAVQRLFWMLGYHVPENQIAYLTRDQVAVAAGADVDLDAVFARVQPGPDGRYRVLASRLLDGEVLGGFPEEGVRADDPNDTIPHQRRRELRGLYVFAAWVNHSDFKEMQTLDVWREEADGSHAVLHYLLDFGNCLGLYVGGADQDPAHARPDDGHVEKVFDETHLYSLASLGLWQRPWEGTHDPGIPGVGAFDVEHFDPAGFTPFVPYRPFLEMDPLDAFWAVQILLELTPAQIRAAVEAGQYDDPRAVDYLTETLVGRQRVTARYWLDRTSPLDDFTVERTDDGDERLCYRDLVTAHRLDPERAPRRYLASAFDFAGAPLGDVAVERAAGRGRRCTGPLPRATDHDGYTIVSLEVEAGERALPAVEVHLARDASARLRVIGVERETR
jgi:hypothetical protein